ncbi:MAG: helix-turn-helix transcriptional regulator, partial [bacterium]|nr:helix-turn-helix transcriptional regulator [bacterium]
TIKLVRVSRQLGSSREQAIGSFGFASLFMTFPVFSFAGTFFSRKQKLESKVYCSWIRGKGLQLLGYFHEFRGDYQASIRSFSNSVHIFQEENDIKELMMSLNGLEHSYHYSGDYTNSKLVIDQLFELAGKTNDSYFLGAVYLYYGRYYLHHANFSLARKYADMAVEISSRKKVWINNCFGLMLKGGVELAQGNNEEALRLYSIAEKEHRKKRFLKQYGNEIYILQAEALLRDFNAKKNSMRPEEYTAASAKLAQAAKVAAGKTRHWPTHYSNALRVYGATCFALGKTSQAIRYLVKSINHSQKYRLRFNHAKALYELGCVLEKSSPRQNPQKSFLEAYEILSELGISIYRDRVEKKLGKYYPKKYSQLPQPIEDISTNKRDISPDIEQKLETGLKYIHENYCFDISREGLSALLEISPNYLSTCFKIYTGEKIYEYITRLRVEEAARQLLNADKTIIEISFSVGFESLRTFNRAFRNILNMTPSEYRLKSK